METSAYAIHDWLKMMFPYYEAQKENWYSLWGTNLSKI